jgi:hypothetical protein
MTNACRHLPTMPDLPIWDGLGARPEALANDHHARSLPFIQPCIICSSEFKGAAKIKGMQLVFKVAVLVHCQSGI